MIRKKCLFRRSSLQTARFISLSALILHTVACGNHIEIERIPGTERAAVESAIGFRNSITISPDGKWLVFWEWIATPPELREQKDGANVLAMEPVSINLETLTRTEHSKDKLPTPREAFMHSWQWLGGRFDPASWYKGKLFIEMKPEKDVFIDPQQKPIQVAPKPKKMNGCSDCPPPYLLRQTLDKAGVRSGDVWLKHSTVAWHNDRISDTVYWSEDGTVEKIAPDGSKSILFQKHIRGRSTVVKRLRVSPNEQYLAYSVYSKLNAPIPLPGGRDDVYIRYLPTGKEKKIASYSATGNFIWSPDSKQLYFAATTSGFREMGVRRVSVDGMF